MTKELTYQVECGPEDILYTFVYEIEPYNKGGRDEPPSGGTASVNEIRLPSGTMLPLEYWEAAGIDIKKIEETIYEMHGIIERDRYEAAIEDKADAEREDRLLGN